MSELLSGPLWSRRWSMRGSWLCRRVRRPSGGSGGGCRARVCRRDGGRSHARAVRGSRCHAGWCQSSRNRHRTAELAIEAAAARHHVAQREPSRGFWIGCARWDARQRSGRTIADAGRDEVAGAAAGCTPACGQSDAGGCRPGPFAYQIRWARFIMTWAMRSVTFFHCHRSNMRAMGFRASHRTIRALAALRGPGIAPCADNTTGIKC